MEDPKTKMVLEDDVLSAKSIDSREIKSQGLSTQASPMAKNERPLRLKS